MTSSQIFIGIALTIGLAVACQITAARFRIPAIILLLPVGFVAGGGGRLGDSNVEPRRSGQGAGRWPYLLTHRCAGWRGPAVFEPRPAVAGGEALAGLVGVKPSGGRSDRRPFRWSEKAKFGIAGGVKGGSSFLLREACESPLDTAISPWCAYHIL